MQEIIQVQNQFYILASAARLGEHNRVLKHGDTFAVFDRVGDMHRIGRGEQGLYHEGTRYLSRLELRVLGHRPLLLSSTVRQDNAMLLVDLTHPDISEDGVIVVPRDQLHVARTSFLWKGACYERLQIRNYSMKAIELSFDMLFEADFADLFEVRGTTRLRRGELLPPKIDDGLVHLDYIGLDNQHRRTSIRFSPPPNEVNAGRARFWDMLPAHEEISYYFTVCCHPAIDECDAKDCPLTPFGKAADAVASELNNFRRHEATVYTSNAQYNDWLNRSSSDLHMMTTKTPYGDYPYAGVPWFSTVFGRDGILTALQYLWVSPDLAKGVLGYLAAHQARETNAAQDAEPGKILHETRRGEMAALGEIPFGCYYGSVDSTPLFIMLAAAYFDRTADLPFIQSIWPNILAAIGWIDQYGDIDGDGFVEYCRQSPNGLTVQGWKDSVDSVFYADGSLAEGPVALCEVQGYVYAAKKSAGRLAELLGHNEQSITLLKQAEELRNKFIDAFWCEEIATYATAMDGRKQLCRVRTSNPGHCLYTGIADESHAQRLADTLLCDASFSGWGVRTVPTTEVRYNPMSYHNGSIWPHDNAILAAGLARYGLEKHVLKIFDGLFDVSIFMDLHRLPELFCGFDRRAGEGPTLYPVACAPQSWAAAAGFSLLQSLLGLSIDATRPQIRLTRSILPESLREVRIRNLRVGEAVVDIALKRLPNDVGVELLRREGDVEVVVMK